MQVFQTKEAMGGGVGTAREEEEEKGTTNEGDRIKGTRGRKRGNSKKRIQTWLIVGTAFVCVIFFIAIIQPHLYLHYFLSRLHSLWLHKKTFKSYTTAIKYLFSTSGY